MESAENLRVCDRLSSLYVGLYKGLQLDMGAYSYMI
jgi:hypothetical protein